MTNTPLSQVPNGQAITGATAAAVFTLDQCVIGGTTPKAGTFTTLTATSGTFSTVSAATPMLVSNGGTGLATLTANNVILGNGTSTPGFVAPSTSGNVLTSNGTTWTSATPSSSAGNLVLLSTLTASSSATIDFTSTYITATYKKYIIDFIQVLPATDDTTLLMRFSQSGTFRATSGDYAWNRTLSSATTGVVRGGDATSTAINIATNIGNSVLRGVSGHIELYDPTASSGAKKLVSSMCSIATAGDLYQQTAAAAFILNGTACDGIRFLMDSGNIASGTIKLYGVL